MACGFDSRRPDQIIGTWRNWQTRLPQKQETTGRAGSSPAVPTIFTPAWRNWQTHLA